MNNNNTAGPSVNLRSDFVLYHLEQYARLGWSVIPAHGVVHGWPRRNAQSCTCRDLAVCPSPGKHPACRWKGRPPLSLRDLIRAREQYRFQSGGWEPNWALVLGRSGVAALDVDTHAGGPDGAAAWADLEREHGRLPATPRDTRGHALFRLPAAAAGWPTKLDIAPGVELFTGDADGTDHILYAPPSEHPSGGSYRWLSGFAPWEVELAELPAWMLERAARLAADRPAPQPARPVSVAGGFTGYAAGGNDVFSRARAYLAKVPGAVEGQGGDHHTFKVACRLVVDFGLSPAEAFPLLAEWNGTCSPPWTDTGLRTKLASANQRRSPRGRLRDADRRGSILDDPEFAHLRGRQFTAARPKHRGPRRGCRCDQCRPAAPPTPAPDFADLGTDAARRAAREAAAETAHDAALRAAVDEIEHAKRYRFRCPKNYCVLMHHEGTGHDYGVHIRCNNWACHGCAAYFKERWRVSNRYHLVAAVDAPDQVHVAAIPAARWDTVRQRIGRSRRRLGRRFGRFKRFTPDDGRTFVVFTTADVFHDVPGAEAVTGAESAARLERLLADFHGRRSPIRGGGGWQLLKEDEARRNECKRLGKFHDLLTDEMVEQFAAAAGVDHEYRPRHKPGRGRGRHRFAYPPGWTKYQRDWFREGLMTGLVPGGIDVCDVTGPPPPEPPEGATLILVTSRGEIVLSP